MAADGLIVLGLDVNQTQAEIQAGLDSILNKTKTKEIILKTAIEKAETEKKIDSVVKSLNKKTVKMGVEVDARSVNNILAAQQKIASTQAKLNAQMKEYRDTASKIGLTLNKDSWNPFSRAVKDGDFAKANEILKSTKKQIEAYNAAVQKMNSDTSVSGSVSSIVEQFSKLKDVSTETQKRVNLLKANLAQFENADNTQKKLSAYKRLQTMIESLSDELRTLSSTEKSQSSDLSIKKKIDDARSSLEVFKTQYEGIGNSAAAQKVTAAITALDTALKGVDSSASGGALAKQWDKVSAAIDNAKRAVAEYNAASKSKKTTSGILEDIKNAETYVKNLNTAYASIGDSAGAEKLKKAISELQTALGNIDKSATGNKLSAQWDSVATKIAEAKRAVAEYNAEQSAVGSLGERFDNITDKIQTALSNIGDFRLKGTGVDQLTTDLTNLQEKAKLVQKDLGDLDPNNAEDVKRLSTAIEELETNFLKLKDNASSFKDPISAQQLATNIEKAKQKVAEYAETYSAIKSRPDLVKELNDLQKRAEDLSTKTDLKKFNADFEQFNTKVKQAGLHTKSLGDRLKDAFKNFASFFSASRVIYEVISKLGEMVQNVKNLDAAMINLRKVTDETDASYDSFLTRATAKAKELGTTVVDLVDATTNFSRLGFSLSEAEELGQLATIYANVGDLSSIDDATNSMISTMKGFGIEAENASSILDKFNEVGNNFAISSGDIGEALQRSASSMAAANNTIDETIALITAANTVVQDATSVGTAFKTISMRIRGATTEMEQAGLDMEGMASSTAELRKEIMALSGVDIMIDDNTFKSTYQIIEELAVKWGELTDIQQASITELIAGKRQGNIISAVMENFDIAQDALNSSLESAGSAMKEYNTYLEGIEAKTNQFKSAFEALSLTVVDSDFLKGIIDFGTDAISVLDKIVQTLGLIPSLIGSIGAVLGGLNKQSILSPFSVSANGKGSFNISTQISRDIDAIRQYNEAIKTAARNNIDLSKNADKLGEIIDSSMQSASVSTKEYVKSQNGAQVAVSGLTKKLITNKAASLAAAAGQAILNAAWSMGISLLITGLITGISKLITYQDDMAEKARETASEIRSAYKTASEEIESDINAIAGLESEFERLSAGVDDYGNNISLSTEEYERYQSIVSEILGTTPQLIEGYDAEGKAITNKNGLIERSIALMKEEQRLRLQEYVSDDSIVSLGEGVVQNIKDYKKEHPLPYDNAKWDFMQAFEEAAHRYAAEVQGNYEGEIYNALNPDNRDLDDFWTEGYWSKFGDNADNFAQEYYEQIVESLRNNRSLLSEYFTQDEIDEMLNIADSYDSNLSTYNSRLEQYSKGLNDVLQIVPQVSDGYENLTDAQKSFISSYINGMSITEDMGAEDFKNLKYEILDLVDLIQNNEGIGNDINSLLANNNLEGTLEQYKNRVNGLIDDIAEATDMDEDTIRSSLGIDDLIDAYETKINYAKRLLSDEYDSFADGLTLQELDFVYQIQADDGSLTWDDLNNKINKVEERTTGLGGILRDLWDSEGFADAKKELVAMAKTLDGITPDAIEELAGESEELAEILELDGMNAEFLAHVLQTVADGKDGFALITDDALKLNDALEGMVTAFDDVTEAKARYDAALAGGEKDDNFKSYAEAFEALNAEFEAGTTNSNAFWAAAEFMFGSEQLALWGWADGLDQIYEAMQKNAGVFSDAESAGLGLLDRLYELSEAGVLVNEQGEKLIEISKNADGSYSFDMDYKNLDLLAEKMNISREAMLACWEALSMWGEVNFADMAEVMSVIEEIGLAAETTGGTAVNIAALTDQLISLGKTDKDIATILGDLQTMDGIVLLNAETSVDNLTESLVNLGLAADDGVTVTVDITELGGLLSELNFTKEQAEDVITKLHDADGISLTNAGESVDTVQDALNTLSQFDFATVQGDIGNIEGAVADADDATTDNVVSEIEDIGAAADDSVRRIDNIVSAMMRVDGTTATVTINERRRSGLLGMLGFAKGTDNAPEGEALVGEEGEELIKHGDQAYLAGTNGPEIVDLDKGDTVYTAEETKRIKHGGKFINGHIPAYDGGYDGGASGTIGKKTWKSVIEASATVKVDDVDLDSDSLEEQLEDTLKEMDEEISKIIAAYEHKIFLIDKNNGDPSEIVAIYKDMQEAVHEQAEEYRKLGLSEDSEYIMNLQKQWWDYHDAIVEVITSMYEEIISGHENQIELTEHWLEQAIESADAMDIARYTGDIVQHYRDMQEAVHEQVEYYRSLGYAETSDEISQLTSLWWEYYDKIKTVSADAWEQVVDNANDALDNIQGMYDSLKNAAQEYAEYGYITVDSLQDILSYGVEYLAFLQDENGQLVINEANIQKVIAARTQQMAIESALNYIQQLRTALTNNDTVALLNLTNATNIATASTWDLVYAQLQLLGLSDEQYNNALQRINAMRSLTDMAVTSIGRIDTSAKEALEETSTALEDLLKYVEEMIKQEVENQISALEDQIDKYREIVDLQKESLDLEREKDKYTKDVTEKTKSIAELQARIAMLDLDDSREAQAEKRKLQEQLAEEQSDLAETQADHAYEATSDMLDNMADAYEKEKQKEIEILEDSISSAEKIYQLAIDRINNHWDTLYDDLINWNYQYGNTVQSELIFAWNAASGAVQQYGSYLNAVAATQAQIAAFDASSGFTTVGTTGSYDTSGGQTMSRIKEIVAQMKANSQAHHNASTEEKARLNRENLDLGEELQRLIGRTVVRGDDGVWYLDKVGGAQLYSTYPYSTYHTGGIVGDDATPKQDEMFALLKKREAVFTEPQQEVVYRVLKADETIAGKLGISGGLYHSMNGSGYAEMQSHNAVMRDMQQAQAASGGNHVSQSIGDVTVPVHVMVTEKLDKRDIQRLSREIGNIAGEEIAGSFIRAGKGTLRGSRLRP